MLLGSGEHILIGLAPGIASVEPKTACEVQMVNRHVFASWSS